MSTLLKHDVVKKNIKAITDAVGNLALLGIETRIGVDSGSHELEFRNTGDSLMWAQRARTTAEIEGHVVDAPDVLLTPEELIGNVD